MDLSKIGNSVMALIIIVGGNSIIRVPVWNSARCGGCEIDLRPFHWPIGIFFILLGCYLLYVTFKEEH
jgi:hypothetical protein